MIMVVSKIQFLLVISFAVFCVASVFARTLQGQANGKHWAVIVAGSNGYYNYRHQADVCHSYQILHKNGIPDEQIIVMMYDDIAYNRQNPTPGIIINQPNGPDVYHGVPKDYTGMDVTPENFLNILTGNKKAMENTGSGKVIESGPNDFIFVNLVDHGAPGIFAFPTSELHARDLIQSLQYMYNNNKFREMVLYVEACESGSLFRNLDKNLNIFATTASNATQSSYACYYDKKRRTYLGDVYSVNWMQDSDKENLNIETLQDQYRIVRKKTKTSQVKEFGDMGVSQDVVDEFQGNGETTLFVPETHAAKVPYDAVASHDVTLSVLLKTGDYRQYHRVLKEHKRIRCQIKKIVEMASASNDHAARYLSDRRELTDYDCYETVAKKYLRTCQLPVKGNDGFNLRQMFALVNMCQDMVSPTAVVAAIEHVCHKNEQLYCN